MFCHNRSPYHIISFSLYHKLKIQRASKRRMILGTGRTPLVFQDSYLNH
ncbi:hypothetical protein HMPREF9176_0896 [Streptococcus downei F0415]|nr:hypothetical protein HMPREF9176_0896 [Streptococcus downei F0415]